MYKRVGRIREKQSRAAAARVARPGQAYSVISQFVAESPVVQRHLFVDSPKDFRKLEDMGMWWGMACEWRNAKNKYGDKVSANPRDYITSLVDVAAAESKLKKGEQLRMLAHGLDKTGGTKIKVGKGDVIAKDKLAEMVKVYEKRHGKKPDKKQLKAMHCFMAAPGGTLDQMGLDKGSLGGEALLIPSTGMVTFSGFDPAKSWSGGSFIDDKGFWKSATEAATELPALTKYKTSNDDKSLLAAALDEVYTKVNQEYIDFANACKQTGHSEGAWPYLNKSIKSKGKTSGFCFITTACTQASGLPDDCEPLTILREFRDQYMSILHGGPAMIDEYYRIAPAIVQRINRRTNSRAIYDELYQVIAHCVNAIKTGNPQAALATYRGMVIELKNKYLDLGDV